MAAHGRRSCSRSTSSLLNEAAHRRWRTTTVLRGVRVDGARHAQGVSCLAMPPLRDRDASTILSPLEQAFRMLRESLDALIDGFHSDLSGYWSTMRALLHASEQTMRAVHFLVADK